MSILITDVLLNGKEQNIHIEENRIKSIGKERAEAEHVIDGKNKAALPGLINTHGHSAMSLLRSYADDMKLHDWLENRIWPLEAKMNEEDVYWGSKLACLEMIKSGTTCFCDMYWHMGGTLRAVEESGMRAVLAESFIDLGQEDMAKKMKKTNENFVRKVKEKKNSRIMPSIGPHAVYTVSEESLCWVKEFAEKEDIIIQFHLAETQKENNDFETAQGIRPVDFLEKIGFLGSNIISAHSVWLTEDEMKKLADHEVKVSHNPTSNLKLASGVMPYKAMKAAGLNISIGTDGCASNNNLDMLEEMKIAALIHKGINYDPTVMPAEEAFSAATLGGARAIGIDAGQIKEGYLADIILVDLRTPALCPGHNLISDLVYSANGSCVDTTICNGKILMENRKVSWETEALEKTAQQVKDILKRP